MNPRFNLQYTFLRQFNFAIPSHCDCYDTNFRIQIQHLMDFSRKKTSLRFKFLKELDSLLRVPKSSPETTNVRPHDPIQQHTVALPSQKLTGANFNTNQTGIMSSSHTNLKSTPTRSLITNSALQSNRVISSPASHSSAQSTIANSSTQSGRNQLPSRPTPPVNLPGIQLRRNEEIRAHPAPLSLPPLVASERPHRPRVTERVKSIKRPPRLQVRSSSTFYIHVDTDVARPPVPPMRTRNRNQVRRSASIDDLLDITNGDMQFNDQLPRMTHYESSNPIGGSTDLMVFTSDDAQEEVSITPSAPAASMDDQICEGTSRVRPPMNMEESTRYATPVVVFSNSNESQSQPTRTNTSSNLQFLTETLNDVHISETLTDTPNQRPTQSFLQRVVSNCFSTVSLDNILNLNPGSQRQEQHEEVSRRFSDSHPPTRSPNNTNQTRSEESLSPSSVPSSNGRLDMSTSRSSGIDTLMSYDTTLDGLKLREKVIWFTDNNVPEVGIIKWLGKLNEKYFAGVEFNNHVGNSSGKWNGRRLFFAALTRGRFVPINELILYSDYARGNPCNSPAKIDYPSWEKKKSENSLSIIICVICQDSLVNLDCDGDDHVEVRKSENSQREQEMVTTPCGHLFHHACLNKWFNIKRSPMQPCPYCQRLMNTANVIRLFPVQSK